MERLHKLHPHVPNNQYTSLCFRSVKRHQFAAFDDGVTCKTCLRKIRQDAEERAEWELRNSTRPNPTENVVR